MPPPGNANWAVIFRDVCPTPNVTLLGENAMDALDCAVAGRAVRTAKMQRKNPRVAALCDIVAPFAFGALGGYLRRLVSVGRLASTLAAPGDAGTPCRGLFSPRMVSSIRRSAAPVAIVALAAVLSPGCSVRKVAVNALAGALAAGGDTYATDDDPELVAAAIPFGLKTIEALLAETPKHDGLLLAAASGFTQYAYAFVQAEADFVEAKDLARATALRARGPEALPPRPPLRPAGPRGPAPRLRGGPARRRPCARRPSARTTKATSRSSTGRARPGAPRSRSPRRTPS